MNRIKRFCALLLVIVLTLGAALPLGVGGVYAENMGLTEQTVEPEMEFVSEPDAEPFTELATESDAEAMMQSDAESFTDPTTPPFTEPDAEPTTEMEGETGTNEELPVLSFYELLMACGSLADFDALMCAEENTAELEALTREELTQLLVRVEEIYAGIEEPTEEDTLLKEELVKLLNERIIVICPECGKENGHAETCSQYVAESAAYPWAEMTDPEFAAWLMDEANAETVKGILGNADSEEYTSLNSRINAIRGGVDAALIQQINEYLATLGIAEPELPELSFYEQLMACVSLADFDAVMCAEENTAATLTREELKQILEHVEGIYASIAQPTEADALLKEELLKRLNEVPIICPVCEVIDGHAEGCPQYMAELVEYWAELNDQELAAWIMDEANAETVKAILESEGEENAALMLRIEAILNGEDTELAMQLQEYLSALMGMDAANVLVGDPSYIYFDLAAGNVNISSTKYSGMVFVDGVAKPVTGTHSPDNKYYVYQSTETNKLQTGYTSDANLGDNIDCRIPVYSRVKNGETPWTKFITNNTDVKKVSRDWETAAATFGRTSTGNYINFVQESGYTANVTIDNIWSSYHHASVDRKTGGIGAHLDDKNNTTICLQLKGDSRVGCVHYSSDKKSGNHIIFSNGDDDSNPGSITVADFPTNFKANHWNSVIGAADNPANTGDMSEGIVINSGVIFAGSTPEDNCTAIGGGGNNYGGVTINGGTITAVVSSTGTAIGGGIGYGSQGGDTDVIINGGTIYAYNLGIKKGEGDNFDKFVPAAAIGGGGSKNAAGSLKANITINGGAIYAQSMGGAAIGGGCSANAIGGPASITITGGTIIAKSTGGTYGTETISQGVSIGGGTGKTGGGSVELNISGSPVLRTGSIGGGKATGSGTIGNATVTIKGGDITGQVIMAGTGVQSKKCSFTMEGGTLHSTNVIDGNTIMSITDPQKDVPILYLEQNGGAVCMDDPIGITNISGGIIENCTAKLGGAIYMTGGTFNLSGTGTLKGNTAREEGSDVNTGLGGAVYISGGTVNINGGSIGKENAPNKAKYGAGVYVNGGTANVSGGNVQYNESSERGGGVYVTGGDAEIKGGSINDNKAQIRGGGVYVIGGNVDVSKGSISNNVAGFGNIPANAGRGGGVYLEGGYFTMTGGVIDSNQAAYRGGGIFLTESPTLTAGTISNNTATDSGGGLCINGKALKLMSPDMKIFGNNATNGGGVAVLNGDFILDGGAVGVESGTKQNDQANIATNGGGVYVKAEAESSATGTAEANVMVNSGNIWYNKAENGGGIYLAKGEGDFTLDGESAIVSHNTATNGGGIYLYKNPLLKQGRIEANHADENGGGMYISDCLVTLNPEGAVFITANHAMKNGAGIYIHGLSASSDNPGGAVDAVSSASPIHRVGLHVGSTPYTGTLIFTDNIATESGGAVCVDVGRFQLDSDKITVTGNRAKNGGGVAVLEGNFTMTNGSIGEVSGANTATNGGGVYVSTGEVWLKGGSVQYNEADNGGGAYIHGGNFIMMSGALTNNKAKVNGGGAYVAGNFDMLGGTVGGVGGGNRAEQNGGGVYVNDGNITVVYGEISYNHATMDGGGFFVSSISNEAVDVVMLSGSLSRNQADANGGGMAVESGEGQRVSVKIGCLRNHNLQNGSPTYPVEYEGAYKLYASYYEQNCKHDSCPKVEHNKAGGIGGGFYMNSEDSTLSFYCVEETNNTAQGSTTAGMDVDGGKVVIGDEYYHNYKNDHDNNKDKHVVPWGYISMDDATLVNGGQVDIYGDMTNPIFREEVAVDIHDQNDHFMDHRRAHSGEKYYKVHYFENFQGKGLYEALQYMDGNTLIDIEGARYSHEGYTIIGWCTEPELGKGVYYKVGTQIDLAKLGKDDGMGTHSIQCDICGDSKIDDHLLELYAIWEVNQYTVVFDPNVPQGKTYTGSMDDQVFDYVKKEKLTKNAYKYPGHFFKGWNMKADGSGEITYGDEELVSGLTAKNGGEVVLYAQWELCKHDNPDLWSYDVIDDGKTLRRICSCGEQTLKATLYAEDTVYDGFSHPAELVLDDEEAWGQDAPTIKYKGDRLKEEDGQLYGKEVNFKDDIPYHAGKYTASITKPDENVTGAVTASVDYIIDKAEQEAPDKPTYEISDDKKTVTINKLEKDPNKFTDDAGIEHKPKAEYCLTYQNDSHITWRDYPEDGSLLTIEMDAALTNYTVQARYQELEDYKVSKITKAADVYFFAGDVTIIINCDLGIECEVVKASGGEDETDGVTLKLKTDETQYYLVSGKYEVTTELKLNNGQNPNPPDSIKVDQKDNLGNEYSVTGIPTDSTLTITIGKTKKRPQLTAQVEPGQVFRSITGTSATISRDSAFTAAFRINNFDPGTYDVPKLTFASPIPENATIILLNRGKKEEKSYWYYCAGAGGAGSVELTSFKKMGEDRSYSITEAEGSYVDLSYQFIVDFSQSTGWYSENSLTMKLEAPVKGADTGAPEAKESVEVTMVNSSFKFENTSANGLTNSFTCTFNITDDASASKWENRASALVLRPNGTDLPPDAHIKAVTDRGTTVLYKNVDSFIIPLSLLKQSETVSLTLQSALFPEEGNDYSFTAEWRISPSKAGKAPKKGDEADTLGDVTFISPERKVPSLKSMGTQRVVTNEEILKLKIKMLNMDGYIVSAALLCKQEDGSYKETGWNEGSEESVKNGEFSVPLGGQEPGSYCLMLTVKKNNSITIVMEVPYYFIIKEAS